MHRKKSENSIWDIDPTNQVEYEYEEFEQLFLAAYELRFHTRAHHEEILPYLNRYFRYRVIPPWLRDYAVRTYGDKTIDDIATAPIDPSFDWHTSTWTLFSCWICLQQTFDPPIPKGPILVV